VPKPAGYFMYGDAGDWWEPDYDELVCQMLWVYDNYAEALDQAHMAADIIARDWTWDVTARRLIRVFGDELTKPYSGDGSWRVPEQRLFPVVLTGTHSFDIAGITYQFTKGVEQWAPADVKRIMFEAGYLDPACIADDDEGLTRQQAAMVGRYTYEHAHCHACGQPLNSKPTLADSLEHA
jgi:hypothetical protein